MKSAGVVTLSLLSLGVALGQAPLSTAEIGVATFAPVVKVVDTVSSLGPLATVPRPSRWSSTGPRRRVDPPRGHTQGALRPGGTAALREPAPRTHSQHADAGEIGTVRATARPRAPSASSIGARTNPG